MRDAKSQTGLRRLALAAVAVAALAAGAVAQRKEPPEKLTRYQEATKLLGEARSLARAREYKASSELFGQFIRVHRTYQDIPLVMIEAADVFGAAGEKDEKLKLLTGVKVMAPLAEYSAEARCRLAMIAYKDAVDAKDEEAIEKAIEELALYLEKFPHAYGFDIAVETVRDYYIRRKMWDELEKLIEFTLGVYEPASQLTVLHEEILPRIPLPEKLELALRLADQFIGQVKDTYEEALLLGAKMRMLTRADKPAEALTLAREIRERWPKTPAAENAAVNIADLLTAQGKIEEAVEAEKRVLTEFDYRSDNPKREGEIVNMYLRIGKPDEAEKFLRQRDKIDPVPADMYHRMNRYIQVYVAKKDPAGLSRIAAEMLSPQQGPQRWKRLLDVIVTHLEQMDQAEEAVKLLDGITAAKIDPEDRAASLDRKYSILSRQKDQTAAHAVAREYCKQFPAAQRTIVFAATLAAAKGPASRPVVDTTAAEEAKKAYDQITSLLKADPVEAVRLTDKLVKTHPTCLLLDDARYACINALRAAGSPREAVVECNKFVATHPLHQLTPRIFSLLATLERDEYNYANAAASYERLMAHWRPTSYGLAETASRWVSSLNGIKNYTQAVAVADQMAKDVSTPYIKGRILWLKVNTLQAMDPPRHAEAVRTLREIAEIRGGWTRGRMSWYAVGQVFGKAADTTGSEAWLKACSTQDPYSREGRLAAMSLIDRMRGRKDYEGADAAYVRVIKQYPKSPTAGTARYYREWMWWQVAHDYARALKVAEEYINLWQTPYTKSRAYHRIASYNGGLKRWRQAITAVDKAMQLWPRRTDLAALMLAKAEYLFQLRKGKEAVALIKQVQARWRDVYWGVRALDALAYLYLRGGAARTARSAYRSLVSKYPSSLQADRAKQRYNR